MWIMSFTSHPTRSGVNWSGKPEGDAGLQAHRTTSPGPVAPQSPGAGVWPAPDVADRCVVVIGSSLSIWIS